MYVSTEKCLNRSAKEYADGALVLLETFNRSESDERCEASDYIFDLYNLGYAFFRIRTMMAKGPDTVPHDWLLRREVSRARRNVLARYPRLLNERIVNEGFNALEELFEFTGNVEAQPRSGTKTTALAVSHFFQNILHNIFVGSRYGLLDLDRALGKPSSAQISPTHDPDQRLLI
ncbi:hypothetical protein I5192_20135 (plasmid) [Ruegeria sp. SCSIO 43209]|uniref:hypothetical protein n=1 Tax=Ruegeria sp. SCSIO 43209 TaxID=2793010 RepID=UPI001CA87CBF|nr:hypothetical protein [Ruegeria sp. SCSIO 43209]UAB91546.1 hypothetical protein I5192_20135 [Ruegeria sp. SCSIO 43209]